MDPLADGRAKSIEHAHAYRLRPQLADYPHESLADFKRRAAQHYDAMAKEAKRFGVSARPRPARTLERSARWLVAYQLGGESFATIASRDGSQTIKVRKTVHELAKRIESPLRKVSRKPRAAPVVDDMLVSARALREELKRRFQRTCDESLSRRRSPIYQAAIGNAIAEEMCPDAPPPLLDGLRRRAKSGGLQPVTRPPESAP